MAGDCVASHGDSARDAAERVGDNHPASSATLSEFNTAQNQGGVGFVEIPDAVDEPEVGQWRQAGGGDSEARILTRVVRLAEWLPDNR